VRAQASNKFADLILVLTRRAHGLGSASPAPEPEPENESAPEPVPAVSPRGGAITVLDTLDEEERPRPTLRPAPRRKRLQSRSFELTTPHAALLCAAMIECRLLDQLVALAAGAQDARPSFLRSRGAELAVALRDASQRLCPREVLKPPKSNPRALILGCFGAKIPNPCCF